MGTSGTVVLLQHVFNDFTHCDKRSGLCSFPANDIASAYKSGTQLVQNIFFIC